MLTIKNQVALIVTVLVASCIVMLAVMAVSPVHAAVNGLKIESGNPSTQSRKVTVSFTAPDNVKKMKVSLDKDLDGARWETYKKTKSVYLEYGEGSQKIYVQYLLDDNKKTSIYSDAITLNPPPMKVKVEFAEDDPISNRYATVSSTVSKGVDAYRLGTSSNFGDKEFEVYQKQIPIVVTRGGGVKDIYIEFKDASGETETHHLAIKYNQPGRYIEEGSLIKGTGPAVYYYGFDGLLHPFTDGNTYTSWYSNFDSVNHISDAKLRQYKFGDPVCIRQGTWLVKFRGLPRVYAVERGCTLRPLRSATEAYLLYGKKWYQHIVEYDQINRQLYTVKEFDVTDEDNDIEDKDKDGLSADQEEEYGSSDEREDTDFDGLTDYEEIKYWFSDPNDADSDNDGFSDGSEILNGYSPVGPEKLSSLPSDTYTYPEGVVFIDAANKDSLMYSNGGTNLLKIGKSSSKNFTTNRLQERFVVRPPFKFSFPKSSGSLKAENDDLRRPQTRNKKGDIVSL